MDIVDTQENIIETDDFDAVEATISDVGVMYHLLTTIYTDKPAIVVQEYAANARDAHRFLNKEDVPFDITLPTYYLNEISIRDYGPGIKHEDMANVFIKLGSSTKRTKKELVCNESGIPENYVVTPETRNNIKMTGGFGIGAKSAFCYTDNFTVESYVDGVVRIYSFVKSGQAFDGTMKPPKLLLLSEEETEEPNGIKIIVAINPNDRQAFINNVYKKTQFWTVRPNIVNAKTNDQTWANLEVMFSGDKWIYVKEAFGTHIVVDGIPYGFNLDAVYPDREDVKKYEALFNTRRFIFKFDAGDVSINPNREAIQYDNNSIIRIRKVIEEAVHEMRTNAQSIIDSASTLSEIKAAYHQLSDIKSIIGKLNWRGIDFSSFSIDRNYFNEYSYNFFKRKINVERNGYRTNYNYLEYNAPKIYINDEEEINIRRIHTLLNRGEKFIVLDLCGYDKSNYKDHMTEDVYDENCAAYEKNILKIIGFKFLNDVEEYIKPKAEKIPGNIYRFRYNTSSSRDAWDKEDVDFNEVEGYYVKFDRGNIEGFSTEQLQKIKDTFKICIYGVPDRYIGKLKNNEDMIPLKDFIEEHVNNFKEKIEKAKEKIFLHEIGASRIRECRNEFKKYGLSIIKEASWIPELQDTMNLLGKMEYMISEEFDYSDIKATINFLDEISNTRISVYDNIDGYDLMSIKGILVEYYPMLVHVNDDNIRHSVFRGDILEYMRMVNKEKYSLQLKMGKKDCEEFSYEI